MSWLIYLHDHECSNRVNHWSVCLQELCPQLIHIDDEVEQI